MEFKLENPLANFDRIFVSNTPDVVADDGAFLFPIEHDHMPSPNYLKSLRLGDRDVSLRGETVSLISQLSCEFSPLLSYLAVNYLDRFLSSHHLHAHKPWILRLLAVSCVALASKMLKMELPLATLQGDGGLTLEASTIQRMEMLILGALKWRMRSVTPFSFLPFFIPWFKQSDPPLRQALKDRAIEIIFKSQHDVGLLEFRPSIIAASALLTAAHELYPLQFPGFKKAISSCSFVSKEDLSLCYDAMVQGVATEGYEPASVDVNSRADTPVNVLDHHFSSSSSCCSDDSEVTNGETGRRGALKRRKTH